MSVQIASTTHNFAYSQRTVFRASDGIMYAVSVNGNFVLVSASNSRNPSAFAVYSSADQGAPVQASAGMGTDDIIHICFLAWLAASTDIRYMTFNCSTKTFTAAVTINADIGSDPAGIYLYSALAVDVNNVPHFVATEYPSIMGTNSLTAMYRNKVGGSWNTAVTVRAVQAELDYQVEIAINASNLPIITMVELANGASPGTRTIYKGSSNVTPTFTRYSGLTEPPNRGSLVIDKDNIEWVAYMDNTATKIGVAYISGSALASYVSTISTGTPPRLSAFITGTSLYILYKNSSNGLSYVIFNTSSKTFGTPVVIETGSFNMAAAGWSYWNRNDSVDSNTITGRADGNGSTDGAVEWVNPENIFDTSDTTVASITRIGTQFIKTGTSFTESDDTNFPVSQVIVKVKQYTSHLDGVTQFRIYSGATLVASPSLTLTAQYITSLLDVPPGGWTWDKVKALRCAVYSGTGPPTIYVYKIDFIVMLGSTPEEIDYVYTDATTAYPYWDKIVLSVATAWVTKILKWYNGSSWVTKPLKSYIGGSWQTKIVKRNM